MRHRAVAWYSSCSSTTKLQLHVWVGGLLAPSSLQGGKGRGETNGQLGWVRRYLDTRTCTMCERLFTCAVVRGEVQGGLYAPKPLMQRLDASSSALAALQLGALDE
jgi:hypothetical protein